MLIGYKVLNKNRINNLHGGVFYDEHITFELLENSKMSLATIASSLANNVLQRFFSRGTWPHAVSCEVVKDTYVMTFFGYPSVSWREEGLLEKAIIFALQQPQVEAFIILES